MAKPVRCARCGRENEPSFAFCLDCGQRLEAPAPPRPAQAVCAGCGAPLAPAARFCVQCGRPTAAAAPAAAAPRPAQAAPPPGSAPRAAPPAPAATAGAGAGALPATERTAPLAGRPAPGQGLRLAAVRADGLPGATFRLEGATLVCGRKEGEIRLPDDATVSPRHVRFRHAGGRLEAEDLGSVNGTFVRLRAPRRLAVGDELRVGRQLLRLEPLPRPPAGGAGARPWGSRDAGATLRLSQLLEGGGTGEVFPLRPGENLLGREAGDVTFPSDRYVSARHARLEVSAETVLVTDAGSSNGTFVRIAGPIELGPGDQLLVGGQLFRVEG